MLLAGLGVWGVFTHPKLQLWGLVGASELGLNPLGGTRQELLHPCPFPAGLNPVCPRTNQSLDPLHCWFPQQPKGMWCLGSPCVTWTGGHGWGTVTSCKQEPWTQPGGLGWAQGMGVEEFNVKVSTGSREVGILFKDTPRDMEQDEVSYPSSETPARTTAQTGPFLAPAAGGAAFPLQEGKTELVLPGQSCGCKGSPGLTA